MPSPVFADWPPSGLLDHLIDDAHNFHLPDGWLGLIISALSGLSLLLLNDVVFRAAVRAHRDDTSSSPVRRHSLVARVCNPFLALAPPRSAVAKTAHTDPHAAVAHASSASLPQLTMSELDPVDYPHAASPDAPPPHARMRWAQPLAIALCALLLVCADLLLIFLSTNRTTTLRLPASKIRVPAFGLSPNAPTGPPTQPPYPGGRCVQRPMTARPGFLSRASAFRCSMLRESRSTLQDNGTDVATATVSLALDLNAVVCAAAFPDADASAVSMSTRLSTYVTLPDGVQYFAAPALEPNATARALRAALQASGIRVLSPPTLVAADATAPQTSASGDDWAVRALVDFRSVTLSGSFASTQPFIGLAEATDAHRRLLQLMQTACSRVGVHASARGARVTGPGVRHARFLDEVVEPLVVSQRPWLSAAAAGALTGALAALWMGVALGLRWQACPDYDAFMRLFAPVREWSVLSGPAQRAGADYWDAADDRYVDQALEPVARS